MYTRLIDYVKNNMILTECQEITSIKDDNEFLCSIVNAYNRYVKSHNKGITYLIKNADHFFVDENGTSKFINELRQYVIDVIIAKQREDMKNANTISQTTDNTTA